jgi:hypothetical protein
MPARSHESACVHLITLNQRIWAAAASAQAIKADGEASILKNEVRFRSGREQIGIRTVCQVCYLNTSCRRERTRCRG